MADIGATQRLLLETLRSEPAGTTIDELARALAITRTAVQQHLVALERDGYVMRGARRRTSGRPVQSFLITDQGLAQFPKQYSWFAALVLGVLARERGSAGLAAVMRGLGRDTAAALAATWPDAPTDERIRRTATAMRSLGYEATAKRRGARSLPVIEAHNCVFHQLARERNEVCQFDLALLERLTGAAVVHDECIVRGGGVCRFTFAAPKQKY
jgi:predicted ArsR family transcriptional regulator